MSNVENNCIQALHDVPQTGRFHRISCDMPHVVNNKSVKYVT